MTHSATARDDAALAHFFEASYGHLELFNNVDFRSIAHLLPYCELIEIEPEEAIVEPDQQRRAIYLIVSGRVEVRLAKLTGSPLITLGPGACFGELSILSHLEISANIVAQERTRVLVIEDEILWSLIQNCHPFACNLLDVLSGRNQRHTAGLRCVGDSSEPTSLTARVDTLTGLHNRQWLDHFLDRIVRRCNRDETPLCLLMIDLDNFHRINEQHGHLVGDEVLRNFAAFLREKIRPRDIAVRYAGDEFLVFLHSVGLQAGYEIAERFRQDLCNKNFRTAAGEWRLSVSIGIASLGMHQQAPHLLAATETALAEAKQLGHGRVISWTPADVA